ncbi:hypothetical protein VP01_1137g1 [Puccinia sorghi]|uniref:Uncharacterized protein n=1 Tax=Puccinia sorghi TaxID=27349 RepID=A0A0L6VS15_9BASI|nr:hypothetical protein VP01_1137g1 [Puccinia sorghi]
MTERYKLDLGTISPKIRLKLCTTYNQHKTGISSVYDQFKQNLLHTSKWHLYYKCHLESPGDASEFDDFHGLSPASAPLYIPQLAIYYLKTLLITVSAQFHWQHLHFITFICFFFLNHSVLFRGLLLNVVESFWLLAIGETVGRLSNGESVRMEWQVNMLYINEKPKKNDRFPTPNTSLTFCLPFDNLGMRFLNHELLYLVLVIFSYIGVCLFDGTTLNGFQEQNYYDQICPSFTSAGLKRRKCEYTPFLGVSTFLGVKWHQLVLKPQARFWTPIHTKKRHGVMKKIENWKGNRKNENLVSSFHPGSSQEIHELWLLFFIFFSSLIQRERQHVHISLLGTKGPLLLSKAMCAHCLNFGPRIWPCGEFLQIISLTMSYLLLEKWKNLKIEPSKWNLDLISFLLHQDWVTILYLYTLNGPFSFNVNLVLKTKLTMNYECEWLILSIFLPFQFSWAVCIFFLIKHSILKAMKASSLKPVCHFPLDQPLSTNFWIKKVGEMTIEQEKILINPLKGLLTGGYTKVWRLEIIPQLGNPWRVPEGVTGS